MTTTLLLFDVDGVLIYPRGYKEALQATIDYFARQMGQRNMAPSYEDIAAIEAAGITNEWDSAPMCVGALLAQALSEQPDLVRESADATFTAVGQAGLALTRPDYGAIADRVKRATPDGQPPTGIIHAQLKARVDERAYPVLNELLGNVYTLRSPTTVVFHHFGLGSTRFTDTFGQRAWFESESMLIAFDKAVLAKNHRETLVDRAQGDDFGFCIYTARPSLPPADLLLDASVEEVALFSPEGDLAAELLGLTDLPLIAGGRIGWLASARGKHPSEYIKPSPVQALAAIGAAFARVERPALEAAADLVDRGELRSPLADLPADLRVLVFEDSTGGIRAVRKAVALLREHRPEMTLQFEAVGVATEETKIAALKPVVTMLASDVNEALERIL